MRHWRAANRAHVNAKAVRDRKAKWQFLRDYKVARGCAICGERRGPCLDFHHRDPTVKEGNLSVMTGRWSLARLQAEAEKCMVVCANCHRVLHESEGDDAPSSS